MIMDLSVIICTWNNSRRLGITLDSISQCVKARNVHWQLVVVNNNCTDPTDEVVRTFLHRLPIAYVKESIQGLSRARNAGLAAASGELIVFTDDDVKPCQEWLETYWRAHRERPTGFYFGGPVESEYETVRPDDELLGLAPPSVRGLYLGNLARPLQRGEFFISANWACPREALISVKGFDVRLGLNPRLGMVRVGEERDLMGRLKAQGLSAWYLPAARVVHFVPATKCCLKHIAARREAHAFSNAHKLLGGDQGAFIFGLPRWMYRTAFELLLRWIWARVRGRRGYQEYVQFRSIIGTIRGAAQ